MFGQGPKFVMDIKRPRRIIDGVHHRTDRGDFTCVLPTPMKRIHQEKTAQILTSVGLTNCQPPQQRGWKKWISREFLRHGTRQLPEVYGISGKCVVPD